MFDEAIFNIPEIIEYQVVFDKKNGKDFITVIAESQVINESIREKIADAIMKMPEIKEGITHSKTIAKPQIKLVEPNTFDRNSIKAKRLIDNRNLYD